MLKLIYISEPIITSNPFTLLLPQIFINAFNMEKCPKIFHRSVDKHKSGAEPKIKMSKYFLYRDDGRNFKSKCQAVKWKCIQRG